MTMDAEAFKLQVLTPYEECLNAYKAMKADELKKQFIHKMKTIQLELIDEANLDPKIVFKLWNNKSTGSDQESVHFDVSDFGVMELDNLLKFKNHFLVTFGERSEMIPAEMLKNPQEVLEKFEVDSNQYYFDSEHNMIVERPITVEPMDISDEEEEEEDDNLFDQMTIVDKKEVEKKHKDKFFLARYTVAEKKRSELMKELFVDFMPNNLVEDVEFSEKYNVVLLPKEIGKFKSFNNKQLSQDDLKSNAPRIRSLLERIAETNHCFGLLVDTMKCIGIFGTDGRISILPCTFNVGNNIKVGDTIELVYEICKKICETLAKGSFKNSEQCLWFSQVQMRCEPSKFEDVLESEVGNWLRRIYNEADNSVFGKNEYVETIVLKKQKKKKKPIQKKKTIVNKETNKKREREVEDIIIIPDDTTKKPKSHEELLAVAKKTEENTNKALEDLANELKQMRTKVSDKEFIAIPNTANEYSLNREAILKKIQEEDEESSSSSSSDDTVSSEEKEENQNHPVVQFLETVFKPEETHLDRYPVSHFFGGDHILFASCMFAVSTKGPVSGNKAARYCEYVCEHSKPFILDLKHRVDELGINLNDNIIHQYNFNMKFKNAMDDEFQRLIDECNKQ
jgi:hypothetical protein